MRTVCVIFARSGSKGIKNKNIKALAGKTLLEWSIEVAKKVKEINRIIVSTDSQKIKKIALKAGAEVPFIRPKHLATDKSPEWLSWIHAIKYIYKDEGKLPDAMISLPTTSPLRNVKDVKKCILEYKKNKSDAIITITQASRNPYFNMVSKNDKGYCNLAINNVDKITHRQKAPLLYDMTTVAYVVNPKFILSKESLFEGKIRSVYIPKKRSIDIDDIIDFEIAEFLKKKGY
tara:strand:- start:1487 stop:2182 length:696 start_codon:yes stop_codon:yes gene_type:complete